MARILLVAAACVITLSQPGFAMAPIKLSRPNTGYLAFMDDRNACLNEASHRVFSGNTRAAMSVRFDLDKFADCMKARGYKLDPNGYRAAWYDPRVGLRPDHP